MGINGKQVDAENGVVKIPQDNEQMTSSQVRMTSPVSPRDSLCSRICCVFEDRGMRRLYSSYTRRTRRESPCIFLLLSLLASLRSVVTSAAVLNNAFLPHLIISVIFVIADVIFVIVYNLFKSKDSVIQFVMYYSYITLGAQVIVNLVLGEYTVPLTDSLDWSLVFIYASLVLVPMFLYQCVIMACVCVLVHLVTSSVLASRPGSEMIHFSATLVSQIV